MKYRLYYWFRGAPEDRPGGPWWYRDFETPEGRDRYRECLEPALVKWSQIQGADLPVHGPMDIRPPKGATVYEVTIRQVKS